MPTTPRPLPTIAGTVRATFRGTNAAGRTWANVVHCRYATGASNPGPTEIAALDALLARIWTGATFGAGTPWLIRCPATTTLVDATYYVLNGTSTPVAISHTAAGTAAGTLIPQEVAHVLTLRTAKRGRRYRGRIYLPAASTAWITGSSGNLAQAAADAMMAQLDGLVSAIAAIQWEFGVATYGYSVHKDGTVHDWPAEFTPLAAGVSGRSMNLVPDVMRRRKGIGA